MSETTLREIPIGRGRALLATPVFDTYWRFAQMRQDIFHRRVRGASPPWTDDPVLRAHRFTNPYRASDRVSQFLIRQVIYSSQESPEDIFFRCLLFKLFNRIDTWMRLLSHLGEISWKRYNFDRYAEALDSIRLSGKSIYSRAYIMPSPPFGSRQKHRNHLKLLECMMYDKMPTKILSAPSLESVFRSLLAYPSMGPFLAFQYTIDLNYSQICNFSEMDFVVAGPGARDGIRKCFADTAGLSDEEVIRVVTDRSPEEFTRLGLVFDDLWGRKLQLIDCQNLFCEVDKYARVMHPEYSGVSGRTRIKQRFDALLRPLPQWYPPKWGIQPPMALEPSSSCSSTQAMQISLFLEPAFEPTGSSIRDAPQQ